MRQLLKMFRTVSIVVIAALAVIVDCQFDPHQWPGSSGIVELFEWKWKDIALECEQFLSVYKYGGVQISPPQENLVIKGRPWYERYEPVSYKLTTRSGNEQDFLDMTFRCNSVGVRIYADIVFDQMATLSSSSQVGTGGSVVNTTAKYFPAVPYTEYNFGDDSLDLSSSEVRDKLVDYMNRLINLGVAGFKIGIASRVDPKDIEIVLGRLRFLNIFHGFFPFAKPFIYFDLSGVDDSVKISDYTRLGYFTELKFAHEMGVTFRGLKTLSTLKNFGSGLDLIPSQAALTFVDNHSTQRATGSVMLSYKDPKAYKMATAFHLAWPYGFPLIMSSFEFDNFEQGPPMDSEETILSPTFKGDGSCGAGRICEHRWRLISSMILFRNAVGETQVQHWWDNGSNQIAFSRGNIGFIAFNNEANVTLNATIQTGLPAGSYCDIISGNLYKMYCTGKYIEVGSDGMANVYLSSDATENVIAFFRDSKVPNL